MSALHLILGLQLMFVFLEIFWRFGLDDGVAINVVLVILFVFFQNIYNEKICKNTYNVV